MEPQDTEATPLPTDAELGILRVLWQRGPSTVREVLDGLLPERKIGYTTVLKLLQIMHEKGLVLRDEGNRTHVYTAGVAEQRTENRLVADVIDRAFAGSTARLVIRALSTRRASTEELNEIRRMIGEMEK